MTIDTPATVTQAVEALTLEQKAALTSGEDFWTTKAVPGVPSIMLTDGRNQHETPQELGLVLDACEGRFVCEIIDRGPGFDDPAAGVGQTCRE